MKMEEIRTRILSLATEIAQIIDEDCLSIERLDSIATSAERLLRAFVMMLSRDSTSMMEGCVRAMQGVVRTLNTILSNIEDTRGAEPYGYYLPLSFSGGRGSPKLCITAGVLNYFISHGFSASAIAMLLHVSLSTVCQRMTDYGITIRNQYSTLSDTELDRVLTVVQHSNPNCGYRLMQGYLERLGHRVQQYRIRESMARNDPIGIVISRWCSTVQRRQYSVGSPNQLWHIDGNHCLIRWRLVIHAGVDGYSRIPVYCHCSDNNKSDTVTQLFLEAVSKYGLPSRVRCDKGNENHGVGYFMLSHAQRGPERGSIIPGRSVHNQRVERFWRDLFVGCISVFYHLFNHMEDTGLLDPMNAVDLFCLHFVYKPYINYAIQLFVDAWCSHPMRSASNRTPTQLWIEGMLNNSTSGMRVTEDHGVDDFDTYGIDWDGPVPDEDASETIEIPEVLSPLNSIDVAYLEGMYSNEVILASDSHAVDVYINVKTFIASRIH